MKDKRRICNEEEKKRIGLYKQGLNDREIAERCGVTKMTISSWRYRRGLPGMSKSRKPCKTGVRMEKALTPEQCRAMRRFLNDLIIAHNTNPNLDVGSFMTEYRKIDVEEIA